MGRPICLKFRLRVRVRVRVRVGFLSLIHIPQ